ncbi:patatin-like phospholipase family protein [Candidatus Sumerlaeota bacterium]|nr:patatin-like phospholipase family protein [Candidatus Sumerlaeota bacterium]
MAEIPVSKADPLSILRKVELFQDLDDGTIAEIVAHAEEVTVLHDNPITQIGEEGTHFYIVLVGRVRIVLPGDGDDAPPTLLKIHGPAGFFGEMSLLTGDPISADVLAAEDCRLLRLTKEQFEAIYHANPSVLLRLNRVLSRNLSATNVMVRPPRCSKINAIHRIGEALRDDYTSLYIVGSIIEQSSKRVLLVDFESTLREPLKRFGAEPETDPMGVFDAGRTFASINEFRPHCARLGDRLDILTFPRPLSECPDIEATRLQTLYGVIRRLYDAVLLDTGHVMHPRVLKILPTCDHIYLLAPDQPGHGAVAKVVKSLDLGQAQMMKRLRIGIIGDFDMENPRPVLSPLLEATGVKNIFLLGRHHVSNFHLSKDLVPVINTESPTGRRLASLAREVGGMRVGLVLGSGGAKGFAHIGVMRVLEDAGIPVDVIVGCSMGAIIGACFALGHNSHEVEQMARELWARKGAFFDWQIPPWANIVKGKKVDRMADAGFKGATMLDCVVPFAALAFDLLTGQEVIIDEGTIKNAVRTSGSMPGIMRPVTWKGMYLIDGGVSNKVPVDVLSKMGTDFNIAVNVAPEVDPSFYDPENPRKPGLLGRFMGLFSKRLREMYKEPNIIQIMARTYSTSATKLTEAHLHLAHACIRPNTDGIGMLDFLKLDECIACGEAAAREHVEEIAKGIENLRRH